MKRFFLFIIVFISFSFNSAAASFTIETENMTMGGSYAGKITNPFSGIALYANNDKGTITQDFPEGPGFYRVSITGASSNTSSAGVSLYVNGTKIKAYSFSGTSATAQEADLKLTNVNLTSNTIALILETDNGSNDTYIDKITFTFQGAIVEKDPPVLPAQGAYYTGVYRNMLKEAGYTDTQISQRLEYLWNRMFYGNATTEAVYYPVGNDQAYILDTGNDDIRSEGMSYGMMICVQMDKKAEFDRLWKWAKTNMQFQTGPTKGYFSWQVSKDGSSKSPQPAPDGDEYFAMALMFASGRWGNGEGINNYWKEANYILENSVNKGHFINSSITNMFDEKEKQIVFVPYAASAKHTDPSYHLPSFYQLWSHWADNKRWFWAEVANKSREMFPKFANAQTGLMPDYANFDGTATGSSHADFRFDAWRCAMNMGMDYAWFKASEDQVTLINRLHNFFASKGVDSYKNQYSLIGAELSGGDHSPGLVACNAGGALASNQRIAWDFIQDFFTITPTSGQYRYYDGLLYFLNYLHLSGNFKIYKPANVLDVALDEQYQYSGQYLVVENFETKAVNDEFNMRKSDSSTATALVKANPTASSEKSLQILPGNYDEYFVLQYKLPAGMLLKTDYTHLEFDVFYDVTGDNQSQDFRVDFDVLQSTPFFKTSTGLKANHGKWEHITVPLTGVTSGNAFKLYLGIRTRAANYYIDNLKLKLLSTSVNDIGDSKLNCHYSNNVLYLNSEAEKVSVYSLNGDLLLTDKNKSVLNVSTLSAGVYIVKAFNSGKEQTLKFVKGF
ncbi:MAG TPA: glycosyl hydrolase family 8 [Bacteroidales bacterium]|nr:glycosyl hydrolase family 8 [Bacteroidales bacterium]